MQVEVSSSNDIKEVRFYKDGKQSTKDSSAPYGYNYTFDSSDIGEHEFRAVATDEDGNSGENSIKLNITGPVDSTTTTN